jgi:hypothetical protein
VTLRRTLGAALLAGVGLLSGPMARASGAPGAVAYTGVPAGDDTLRVRLVTTGGAERRERAVLGMVVTGFFSPRGLPPVDGALMVTDTGLVFRASDGRHVTTLPVVGPVRRSPQGPWRASAVTLAYVDDALGRPTYLFRLDGGVFATESPGTLVDVAAHPRWLDSLGSREWNAERALVNADDAAAVGRLLDTLMAGAYADSLYAVFGRPSRPVGVVGPRGRASGRLGEYVATRDSLALDPGRISSVDQLRHTLAHELAHRWQARSEAQLTMLWKGVAQIRDPKRYGYRNISEQQAEAAAFAMHFLLSTARTQDAGRAATLDHYEVLVPGTRTMARYFAMQPVFAHHPLRALLTRGRAG